MVNLLWQSPRTPSPNPPLHFMVHRSIFCPINVVYTHILHITVFETHLYIYPAGTWRLNYVNATLHRRQFDIVMKSCACWVWLFIFTQHRQRGTIEMTLICLCVHLSILHSLRLSVCPIFFHNYNSSYIFHRTDLKFYRLPSYHMKMCRWFLLFFFGHFSQSYGPCWFIPCPGNSCHIFYRIDLKLCFIMIWRCACVFEFLVFLFLTKSWPFVIFGIFPTFEPLWPRKLNFSELLVFDYTDYSNYN